MKYLIAVLVFLAGCTIPYTSDPAQWHSTEALSKPREQVLETMATVMTGQGFRIESRDDRTGTITSEWNTRLAPRWRAGTRERAEMQLVQNAKGEISADVRVVREVNDNGSHPMVASEASWIDEGGNEGQAARMVYLLKMKLEGIRLDD